MKIYKPLKVGRLMGVRAYVRGPNGEALVKLLVDTGATYTIIGRKVSELIGCLPALSQGHRRILTASGVKMLPVIEVSLFHCLGQQVENRVLLAHNLPSGIYVDGLLGMDFLSEFCFDIKPAVNEIICRD